MTIFTITDRDSMPLGSIVVDAYAATCVRARVSDPPMPSDWVRVTTAVKGGEHHHGPFLPGDVVRVGWTGWTWDDEDSGIPAEPQRVQPSREDLAEILAKAYRYDGGFALTEALDAVLALLAGQPTVAEVRALFAEELADEEDRATAEEVARSEVAGVRCARCDLRYEEREQYACHEHGPHTYREDELREAGEVRIIPTYAGDELRARAHAERGEAES